MTTTKKNPTVTNPRSFKEIVALRMGEPMCAEHAVNTPKAPIQAKTFNYGMGICYACAIVNNEPKRLR